MQRQTSLCPTWHVAVQKLHTSLNASCFSWLRKGKQKGGYRSSTISSLLCIAKGNLFKSDRENLMASHVYVSKPSFEKNSFPASLGQVISGILQALEPILILNSHHFGKLHSLLLGGLCSAESSTSMQWLL